MSNASSQTRTSTPLVVIGWREWLALPGLRIPRIKAKIDTGARSSSLHALEIEPYQEGGSPFVRFKVHPVQRHDELTIACEAPIHDIRSVRSSSGVASERIVIQTSVSWMGETWTVDLTLANRAQMGFRMLLGREAIRSRVLVDPGRSYLGGKPQRTKSRKGPG